MSRSRGPPRRRLSGCGGPVRVRGVESPLALYRRYRPETFAEVIGQEHVTEPLRRRWRTTGSTTPTSSPVRAAAARPPRRGSWPARSTASRRRSPTRAASATAAATWPAAARGRSTSSRSTPPRTAASTTPATCARRRSSRRCADRYKVYIIDEAHMVTTQGFNALLKLVEEPPPHLRFIFATTEPEKVIADDPLAHPPLPVPADPAAAALVLPRRAVREGGRHDRAGRAAARGARRCRLGPRHDVGARPAARRRRPGGRHPRAGQRPARLHARHAARRGRRRVRGRRRRGGVRGGRQGDRDRAGPAPIHRGPAAPAARPRDRRSGA